MVTRKKGALVSNKKTRIRYEKIREPRNTVGIAYLFLSFLIIGGLYQFPMNKKWFGDRAMKYWKEFPTELKNLDLEYRMKKRHGNSYDLWKFINQNTDIGDYFLIPPQAYLIDKSFDTLSTNIHEHRWSFPNVLTYHVPGVYFVSLSSPDSIKTKATKTILLSDEKQFRFLDLGDDDIRKYIMELFESYPSDLLYSKSEVRDYLASIR